MPGLSGSHQAPHMTTHLLNEWMEKNWPQQNFLLENEQQKKYKQNTNQNNGQEINLSSTVSDSVIETAINPEENCPTIEQILQPSAASDVIENRSFPMDPFGDIISQMGGQDLHGNEDTDSVKSAVSSNCNSSGSVWIMEDMVESSSKTEKIHIKEEISIRHSGIILWISSFILANTVR